MSDVRAAFKTYLATSVLQLSALRGAHVATPSPDPTWGLQLLDANIALGNLIGLVKSEAAAFAAAGR